MSKVINLIGLKNLCYFVIQSDIDHTKPIVTNSHMYSRASRPLHDDLLEVLIGSVYCLCSLLLAKVITLVMALRRSIENHFIQSTNHA